MQPDQVLRHAAFVRDLSRHLVTDPELGEEVAQRTLTIALTHSPRRRSSTRSWLAAIARNSARRLGLTDARRRRRERQAARPEALPSAAEHAIRRETIHRVVDAVFALDEPYRATILARFFDELALREIAQRQGVPVETVRTRLRRGLAMLRVRLDAEYGSRERWALGLVPIAAIRGGGQAEDGIRFGERTSALLEVSSMLFSSKPVVVMISAAIIGVIGWKMMALDETPASSRTESGSTAAISLEVASPAAPEARPVSPSAATSTSNASPAPSSRDNGARLTVRTVWEGASPAASIGVLLLRRLPPEEGLVWSLHHASEGVSDQGGVVEFTNLVPGTYWVRADRHDDGAYIDLTTGEASELVLPLPPGEEITGRVVDKLDRPVPGAGIWLAARGEEHLARCGPVTRTDDSGAFVLKGLRPDHVIGAISDRLSPSSGVVLGSLTPVADGEPDVVLKLGEPAGRLVGRVVTPDGTPVAGAQIFAGPRVQWMSKDRDRRRPDGQRIVDPPRRFARSDSNGHFEIAGLAANGILYVEAMTLDRAPWAGHPTIVAAESTRVEIPLPESPRVVGRVTDPLGRPLPGVSVTWNTEEHSLDVQTRGESDAVGRFQLQGLPVGEVSVRVVGGSLRGPGQARLELARGQETLWNPVVEMQTDSRITGRVLDANGDPLPGWRVSHHLRGGRANDDGRFEIRDLGSESLIPLLVSTPLGFPALITEAVPPGRSDLEIVVNEETLPSAWITGRVTGTAPRFENAVRLVTRFDRRVSPTWNVRGSRVLFSVDLDEGFRIGPITPGTYDFLLEIEELPPILLGQHDLAAGQELDLGMFELEEPGTLEISPRFADGSAPRDLRLTLVAEDGSTIDLTADDARHHSGLVHPGHYRLDWHGRGAESGNRDVQVEPGERGVLELEVERAAVVRIDLRLPETPEILAIEDAAERLRALRKAQDRHRVIVLILEQSGRELLQRTTSIQSFDSGMVTVEASLIAGRYIVEARSVTGLRAETGLQIESVDAPFEPITLELR